MLVPVYGFLRGDVLGLVVLVHDHQRVAELAEALTTAAAVRVPMAANPVVYFKGQRVDPSLSIEQAGIGALDRVDVVTEGASIV